MELQGRLETLRRQGLTVAAISYDSTHVLEDFSTRRGITFPLLSDPGSATIRRFGILNSTIPETNQQTYGVPFPGTFIIGPDRTVTSRFFEDAYQERNTVSSIMARLGRRVGVPATRMTSPQLNVTAYVSDQTVAPGTHFSIVLDLQPARGIHVYAPGVSGYRAIALTINPQPWLSIGPTQFPASEDYVFKPLNEHVPVYQHAVRIVQDLTLDASNDAQAALKDITSLRLTATLQYQACNDRICFSPQTVPMSWTVNVRTLDRERVKP